ncbi:MAG: Holliday junction branch migration protein RuvA [Acidimicrobiia bacterium]|nr:Holliday junction branch migration protein RuvA [Acidimicrobiia bacterium]
MIGSLRGTLTERWGNEVLIEVAGLGHRVVVGPTTSLELGEAGTEVFVYVHDHVREDARTLFGFATVEELRCFEVLLAAHGVGPALAQAILAVHPPAALQRVVADEDLAGLCQVPGVGKKTAQRLLIDLRPRLADVVGGTPGDEPVAVVGTNAAHDDVRAALANLGYGPDEVAAALEGADGSDDAQVLLRQALVRLGSS